MKRFYCFIDTETGGLSPKQHSLLTVAWAFTDYKFNQISPIMHYSIRQPNNCYRVTPEAMKINGIDLFEHSKQSVPFFTIMEEMHNHQIYTKETDAKIILAGQNVKFDVEFLSERNEEFLIPFDRYYFDISNIALFLQALEFLPLESISLETQAKRLGIVNKKPHSANSDLETSIKIAQKYIEIINAKQL
jgi:DNA polymerase III epsilon subunit-like protein